jgi:transcriptional regulator with XRE-family HTH domain
MTEEWRSVLREARTRVGITQAELGKQSGVSGETIRGYEMRRTRPSRDRIEALIAALKMPNAEANKMRESAGYAPRRTIFDGEYDRHFHYTLDELASAVETVPWPEFVVNDALEVVAANKAIQALWGIDYERELKTRTRAQLNLLAVASANQFGDRVKNWDECVGVLISMFKANRPEPFSIDSPAPYFQEVIGEFLKGDPVFLGRLIDVWNRTEARDSKVRWTYPVVWDDPRLGEMRFLSTVSLANEEHATFFNDWIPVDAETWSALDRLTAH